MIQKSSKTTGKRENRGKEKGEITNGDKKNRKT